MKDEKYQPEPGEIKCCPASKPYINEDGVCVAKCCGKDSDSCVKDSDCCQDIERVCSFNHCCNKGEYWNEDNQKCELQPQGCYDSIDDDYCNYRFGYEDEMSDWFRDQFCILTMNFQRFACCPSDIAVSGYKYEGIVVRYG